MQNRLLRVKPHAHRLATGMGGALVALSFLVGSPAALQADEDQQLRDLLEELRTHIDRAEADRLADPWFIEDLRDLVARYDQPAYEAVYEQDFVAEGLREVPSPWQISAGRVAMDWNRGLRSIVEPAPERERRVQSPGDLVGGILDRALGGEEGPENGESASGRADQPARYQLPVDFANAFALEIDLTQRPPEDAPGHYSVAVYQEAPDGHGYRLEMTTGTSAGEAAFALVRQSARGTAQTIEIYDGEQRLQADAAQRLAWTRASDGMMTVSLDDETLFEVEDESLGDPWNGLAVINAAGDLAFSRVALHAAP